jgi:hypothetical protein
VQQKFRRACLPYLKTVRNLPARKPNTPVTGISHSVTHDEFGPQSLIRQERISQLPVARTPLNLPPPDLPVPSDSYFTGEFLKRR